MESSNLLVNLVFVLGVALLGAALVLRLRLSVIVGYILGGIVIGPYTPGFVGDVTSVEALADIGVVLLMFTVGVHLSLRDLMAVGRVAIIGATVQVLVMIVLGHAVGLALGWSWLEALFLGSVVAMSSGVLMSKLLSDQGATGLDYGRIALAWSAVQDLATIVMVVVLSALAGASADVASHVGLEVVKAATFLTLLILLGSRIVPWLLARVATLRNREVFALTVAATALGLAYVSSFFGLSLALGALVAGIVASESELSHQILGTITPLRDIFAGIFFVSVGMLIDPAFVLAHLPLVLLVVLLIVMVKAAIIAGLVRGFGRPLRTALLAGVTLGHAGEFSFLLARVGVDLAVIDPDVFSLMLVGTAGSMIIAPSLVHTVGPMARWIERRRPHPASERELRTLPEQEQLRGHAVICGYGRVGQVIGTALQRRGFPFIAVDQDIHRVRAARARGVPILLGDAELPALLDQMRLGQARILVVALPDALSTRLIVDYARQLNPDLDIVARTHSGEERQYLIDRGVTEVVIGELELALEMTRFTLHRFGVGTLEAQAFLQRLRLGHASVEHPADRREAHADIVGRSGSA